MKYTLLLCINFDGFHLSSSFTIISDKFNICWARKFWIKTLWLFSSSHYHMTTQDWIKNKLYLNQSKIEELAWNFHQNVYVLKKFRRSVFYVDQFFACEIFPRRVSKFGNFEFPFHGLLYPEQSNIWWPMDFSAKQIARLMMLVMHQLAVKDNMPKFSLNKFFSNFVSCLL